MRARAAAAAPLAGSAEAICDAALFSCPGELYPYPSITACVDFIRRLPAGCNDGVHTLQARGARQQCTPHRVWRGGACAHAPLHVRGIPSHARSPAANHAGQHHGVPPAPQCVWGQGV